MKKVAAWVGWTCLSYHLGYFGSYVFFGVRLWLGNREEESLREVLSNVGEAHNRARIREVALGLSQTR